MLFITHLLIDLIFVLGFFPYLKNPLLFLFVSLFATIFPDIDSSNSRIGKLFLFRPINFFISHRGILHSFTFVFIFSIFILFLFKEIFIAFVFGYSLHLILDALTLQGIYFFYPFKLKIKGFIKTGGFFETFLIVVSITSIVLLVFFRFFCVV